MAGPPYDPNIPQLSGVVLSGHLATLAGRVLSYVLLLLVDLDDQLFGRTGVDRGDQGLAGPVGHQDGRPAELACGTTRYADGGPAAQRRS